MKKLKASFLTRNKLMFINSFQYFFDHSMQNLVILFKKISLIIFKLRSIGSFSNQNIQKKNILQ